MLVTIIIQKNLIVGKPLARMNNRSIKEVTSKVLECLSEICAESSRIKIDLYTNDLTNQLESLRESIEMPFDNINIIIKMVSNYLVFYHQDEIITISRTHGDFQKGNIIVNEYGNIFLLDWETVDIRYTKYDYFVYTFSLRNSNNLIKNIQEFIESKDSRDNILVDLSLFILEDIKWYYKETKQLLKGNYSTGLTNYNDNRLLQFLRGIYNENETNKSL